MDWRDLQRIDSAHIAQRPCVANNFSSGIADDTDDDWDPPTGFLNSDFRAAHRLFDGEGVTLARAAAQRQPVDARIKQVADFCAQGWFVEILIVLNIVQGVSSFTMSGASGTAVAYTAHLGGLAFAWFYLRTPSAQTLDRLRQRISPVADIPDETPRAVPRSAPRPRERTSERGSASDEAVAKSKAVVVKRQAPPALPRAASDPRAEALNLVLDKISATGIQSLTSDERKLLDEMSRKLRGND